MGDQIAHGVLAIVVTVALCPAISVVAAIPANGQVLHATESLPSYEVVAIRPASAATIPPGFRPGGGPVGPQAIIHSFHVTARQLIEGSYVVASSAEGRVLGGPKWVDAQRFDIDGKIPEALFAEMQHMSLEQRRRQLMELGQALLADRFKLKVHFETREVPIYELIVAKGGPKLTPSKEPPGSERVQILSKAPTIREMTAWGETLDDWSDFCSSDRPPAGLGRLVVNKTGLTGEYDFTLDWTPEQLETTSEADGPSIFTAVHEQLGLKLVPAKGQVEVVIIDSIEMPSEN